MKREKFFYIGFVFLSAVLLSSAAIIGNLVNTKNESIFAAAEAEEKYIVIDPGHGGEDGGCVSEGGVLEKDLNLSVSYKITEILKTMGYNTVMTRTDDKMLHEMYGDYSGNKKKTYDLKNRVRFAHDNQADVFVSIHMNKFPVEKYSGLQVYYSSNHSDSIAVAEKVQCFCKEYLQNENEREIKRADKSIYVLDRVQVPGILVECGFLSNPHETEKLCTDPYQKELSFVIAAALMEHFAS